jgi:streptogramin lyase
MDGICPNCSYSATLYIKPPPMRTTYKQVAKNISMRNYMVTITRVLLTGAAIVLTADGVLSANPKSLSGVVQTGGTSSSQPLPNVHVTLFEATQALPTMVGQTTTDASGRFTISYRKRSSSSIFFVKADISEGVELVTVLGPNLPASVTVNELSTVATSYSMAQFYRTGVISGNSFGLQIAAGMNDNVVVPATGQSSTVLLNSPNADQTNSLRSTRSLANLLAACVNDPAVTASLFDLTTPLGGFPPHNTAEALANLARDPGQNVDGIYALTLLSKLYVPPLVTMPDAWTVTIKVNNSGDDNMLIGGPGNLAFDERGYAWVTNNTIQGTLNSSRFNLVFKPNGQPADGRNGTPQSPLLGGGILGAGYGVTIDPRGQVWFGNFGWGPCDDCDPSPDGNGSISRFTLTGNPVSPPDAYQGGPVRAQGMASDAGGNIWISSFGNNSVYVFKHGNPHQSVGFDQQSGGGPFDIALAADGSAWVSNGLGEPPASVTKYALVNGALEQQFRHLLGQQLRGISLDSHGNAWVASQGENFVYALRPPDGTEIGHFNGGGVDGPWGVTVDGEDNIWVANFGPLESGPPFIGRLSKLAGVNPPPGKNVGDPISSPTGYTVPTAGSEVLLHNGDPLYGPGETPCFIPIMRQTAVVIDQAGNIWSLNNWKPDFDIDVASNPGGDGVIIFVGLAAPPRPAH